MGILESHADADMWLDGDVCIHCGPNCPNLVGVVITDVSREFKGRNYGTQEMHIALGFK